MRFALEVRMNPQSSPPNPLPGSPYLYDFLQPISLPTSHTPALSHALLYGCGLFVALKKVKPFTIKEIQTLFAKHPGWGICAQLASEFCASPLAFCRPFVFTTLQIP